MLGARELVGKYIPTGKEVNWENNLKAVWQHPSKIKVWVSIDPDSPLLEIYLADFLTQMHKDAYPKWSTAAASSSGKFKTFYMSIRFVKWIKV